MNDYVHILCRISHAIQSCVLHIVNTWKVQFTLNQFDVCEVLTALRNLTITNVNLSGARSNYRGAAIHRRLSFKQNTSEQDEDQNNLTEDAFLKTLQALTLVHACVLQAQGKILGLNTPVHFSVGCMGHNRTLGNE